MAASWARAIGARRKPPKGWPRVAARARLPVTGRSEIKRLLGELAGAGVRRAPLPNGEVPGAGVPGQMQAHRGAR